MKNELGEETIKRERSPDDTKPNVKQERSPELNTTGQGAGDELSVEETKSVHPSHSVH